MTDDNGSLLEVRFRRTNFQIDFRLEWNAPSLVLFGPSGSGKTTLMRVALGLEPEADARFRLNGTWLEDAEERVCVPTHARRIGWVPQSPTLFPDRGVLDNIRFGAREARAGDDIERAVEVLELRDRLGASIGSLSGGERQRVAIARALASGPRALFLDEPLASLDLALRSRVLPFLIRIRQELNLPLIHITHDPDEAVLLGDEIAIVDAGGLAAHGEPRETLWSRAVLPLTTRLGVENVIEVDGAQAGEPSSTRVTTRAGLEIETPFPVRAGESIRLALRAEDILIGLDRPGRLSARNVLEGRIKSIDESGDDRLVRVEAGGETLIAKLTAGAVNELKLGGGAAVYLIIKSQALRRI